MVLSLPISHLQVEFHATASIGNFPHLPAPTIRFKPRTKP